MKRVKFSGFENDFSHFDSDVFKIVESRYDLIKVDEDPDVHIFSCNVQDYDLDKYDCVNLMISAENCEEVNFEVLKIIPWFVPWKWNIPDIINKLLFHKKKAGWKVALLRKSTLLSKMALVALKTLNCLINPDRFIRLRSKFYSESRIFNKHGLWRKNYPIYLKNVKNSNRREYAIICNDIKADNFLNFPYFFHHTIIAGFEEFRRIKSEKLYENKKYFCAFIVRDPATKGRIRFCEELGKYKEVHCYGDLLNNREIPSDLIKKYLKKTNSEEKRSLQEIHRSYEVEINRYLLNQELFRDYKFVICFENSVANDYITEKLPNVMLGNSIAIYKGAPNIGEFFNTKSFINYHDYNSYQEMIDKVIELDQDEKKYREMMEEPFFVDNKIPERMLNVKKDLTDFLDKILGDC